MLNTTNKRLALSLFMVTALALAVATLALAVMAKPAFAADIVVNTTADEDNSDGDCSLREAIIAANTDAARDACPAGDSETDAVTVPAGTYVLTIAGANEDAALTGDLDTTSDTTITGAGARETIVRGESGFADRIFDNGGITEISGLTATGGSTQFGGGVQNDGGTLALRQVAVRGNTASLVAGGVRGVGGTLTIADSTVSGNQAGSNFPGIQQFGGSAFIANSTISDNQTTGNVGGGAGASNGATMTIESSTITNNRIGGIRASDAGTVVNVKNTIVSDNTPDDCDTAVSGGTIASQGNNLSGDDSCGFTLPTDQEDTDPLLDLLADNGGPTDTHALQSGSPAIDGGGSDQAEDQRGVTRPQDGDDDGNATDDIGAFEVQGANTAPEIIPLSPKPGSKIRDRTPRIRATVTDDQTDLAKADVTLHLGGKEKESFSYDSSTDELSFRSRKLKEGRRHTVKIEATDGTSSSSKSWKFTVKERRK